MTTWSAKVVSCHRYRLLSVGPSFFDTGREREQRVVNLLNTSPAPCATGGYVGVSAFNPNGDLIAASAMREGTGLVSPSTLTVAPGASVHFTVGFPTWMKLQAERRVQLLLERSISSPRTKRLRYRSLRRLVSATPPW
jgi:hypothetical protein